MEDEKYIRPGADAILDLIDRSKRIKLMLWAGDARAARNELHQIRQDYNLLISGALEIKRQVSAKYKKNKAKIERQLRQENKGWLVEYLTRAELAGIAAPERELDAH